MAKNTEAHTPASIAEDHEPTLLALADRCEREEPSRELDSAILVACGHQTLHRLIGKALDWEYRPNGVGIWHTMPSPTSSLDAAVTLVPKDCVWSGGNESGFIAVVSGGSMDDDTAFVKTSDGENTTGMALALCAAALRARASLGK